MKAKDLVELGQNLFGKRTALLSLWQEQSENFYPERADFTYQRFLGYDFASNLQTSYPILVRRELGDQIGTMLRPTNKTWAHMVPVDERPLDNDSRRWLQWAENVQRRAMYDRRSHFTVATKQGDNDFATFGNTAIQVRLNRDRDGLLYRTWHLRDMAWMEDENGEICAIWRKWKPDARSLKQLFGNRVHADVEKAIEQNLPFTEYECMHIVVKKDMYTGDETLERRFTEGRSQPWFSIYYDVDHQHLMEAVNQRHKEYVIARWQTVSGSQYAFSPATVAALPEARLLQAMTYTLLEAGEKATNPPVIATQDVVRSDVALYAGGITWIDRDYDEKMGDALRPLTQDLRGLPVGVEMQQDQRQVLIQCFYLNKLTLPQRAPEMTAYEVGQRIQEYIRGALPLFEPMEMDYNGGLCEETFDLLMANGAFGPIDTIPDRLRGAELGWRFESPLHDAIDAQKGQKFLEMKQLIAEAAMLDQSVAAIPDAAEALRDALNGIQVPAKWMRSEVQVDDIRRQQEAARQAQETLAAMQQGSEVAERLGAASAHNAQAQMAAA